MSRNHTYICNPGSPRDGRYTDEQLGESCKCRCARYDHWWGVGPCACNRCDYFRPRAASQESKPTKAVSGGR